jgi:hypothetical protein
VKTYIGCKVTSWEFDFAVGQLLTLKLNIDAMDELRNITKATASYPVNPELLSFAGATVQIAGTTWDVVTKGTLKCDMGYKADRRFARANTLQKEPAEEKFRQIDIDLEGEFDNVLTAYNRIADTTYANSVVQINLAFVGKILIGVTTFPSLTFNMSVAELQDETPVTDGPVIPVQKVKASALYDGTNSPLTIAYVTTDATP